MAIIFPLSDFSHLRIFSYLYTDFLYDPYHVVWELLSVITC